MSINKVSTAASAAAIALALGFAAPALANPATTGTTAAPAETMAPGIGKPAFLTSQSALAFRTSLLRGSDVKAPGGEVVGNINDIVISPDGKVEAVIIGVGGFLGVGEKNVGVSIDSLTMGKTAEGKASILLRATREELNAAPAYQGEKTAMEKVQDKAAELATEAKDKASELATDAKAKAKELTDKAVQ